MTLESIKAILLGITAVFLIARMLNRKKKSVEDYKYLLFSLLITLLIFLIIILKVHHLLRSAYNLPNTITYGLVLVFLCMYILKYKYRILDSNYLMLIISLSFFSAAVIVDLTSDARIIHFSGSSIVEEILRILGSLFWLLYFVYPEIKIGLLKEERE